MRTALIFVLLPLAGFPLVAGSEPEPAPTASPSDPLVLAPVVVEEPRLEPERDLDIEEAREAIERTPGGVAVVGDDEIERTRASSLEDVLIAVPGVYVRSRGTGDEPQISIRGSGLRNNFHIRGINLLVDGFPFQNADGFSEVETFEFLAVRRVEVYKGANSLRFGGNTLGGAINVVTRTGRGEAPARLRAEGGSFGFVKAYGSAAGEGEVWDGFLGASHTRQDGFRDHAEQGQQRAYGSLARELPGGATLRVDGIGVRNRREIPGALTRAELRDDPRQAEPAAVTQQAARDFDYGRGAATLTVPLSDDVRIDWQTQASYQELDHPLPFGIIENETTNVGTELRTVAAHGIAGLDGRLDAGLQGAWTRQPQRILENLGGSEGNAMSRTVNQAANVAAFANEELALTEDFSLVGGARLQWAWRRIETSFPARDSDRVDDWFVSPALGFLWQVHEGVQLYGNASRAVEPGLLLELAAPGNLNGDLDDLDPQRAWQFELGARGRLCDERIGYDLAVFDIELWDEIRNVNVAPFPGAPFTIPRFVNVDRSRHAGLELGLDVVLAEDLAAAFDARGGGELRAETSYTVSRFDYVDDDVFDDNELPGVPRHFVVAGLRWRHDSGAWLAPRVTWVPRRWFVDSANLDSAGSYTSIDVRAGFDHARSGLSLFVEGRNLTDRDYVSAVVVDADDGRFFQPGDGRSVYGGMAWRWH